MHFVILGKAGNKVMKELRKKGNKKMFKNLSLKAAYIIPAILFMLMLSSNAYSQTSRSGFYIGFSFNSAGFDRDGYDSYGYNNNGYDRDGYDRDGYNRDGYNRDGYDRRDYDRDGRERYDNDRRDNDGYQNRTIVYEDDSHMYYNPYNNDGYKSDNGNHYGNYKKETRVVVKHKR